MSKPVSPVAVGGFTIGALLLLAAGIFIFGGGQLLHTDKVSFVVFFDSSLNGLDVGAPVKMQGVKIGQVKEIALLLDPRSHKIYKPVVVEIDRNTFSGPGGEGFSDAMSRAERKDNRDKLVAAGFRARLEMQSLLTGLLYVDIDVHPDKKPEFAELKYKNLLEFPSIPTTTEEIRNVVEEVVSKLQKLPLEEMVKDFSDSLKEIRNLVASEDIKKSRAALAVTLQEMEKAIKTLNRDLGPLLEETHRTVVTTNALIQDVHKDIKPVLDSTDKTLSAAIAALDKTKESMASIDDAVGPESAMNETLESLREATRSIRHLTDYLERHPESIIYGKDN
ncbi:MAG: MlaD family protein [Gammaproteobacteria bacterium]